MWPVMHAGKSIPLWTDKHLWKHYLTPDFVAGGNKFWPMQPITWINFKNLLRYELQAPAHEMFVDLKQPSFALICIWRRWLFWHELGQVQVLLKPTYRSINSTQEIQLIIDMSHFAYACKMRYPLNLVLESWEYLWFYWTFCIVILDYGLKLHKLSNHTLVMLQND